MSCFSLFPPAFLVINLNSFGLFASVFLSAFPSFLFLYRSVFYQILEYLPCLFISFIILYLPPLFLFFSSSFFFSLLQSLVGLWKLGVWKGQSEKSSVLFLPLRDFCFHFTILLLCPAVHIWHALRSNKGELPALV